MPDGPDMPVFNHWHRRAQGVTDTHPKGPAFSPTSESRSK
ncbi:hypothetical protein M087_4944 [Bacteroides fragilis str. S23 R14]|nr:hypothetical protein M087_4944 [Bacteroides fragilis str. S23 R14]